MLRRFSKKNKAPAQESSSTSNDSTARKNKKLLTKFFEFLSSSIWSIPIAAFIESQSVVFDRQQMETEIYYEIHKEYAMLIDTLIECFCEDVGTTSAELVEAIRQFDQKDLPENHKVALEPLLAAQNFNVFVPMMMRKNIELQLQALQMIEFMCGLIPSVLQLEEGETLRHMKKLTPEETERYVLISVLRHSKDEYEAMQKGSEEMEQMARNSRVQREQLEHEIRREEILLQKALKEGAKRLGAGTQTDGPQSVAAVMASHFTIDTGTSVDDITVEILDEPEKKPTSTSTSGTMTSPEARSKSAKRAGSAVRKNSKSSQATTETISSSVKTETSTEESQQQQKRPGTAKGPNQRKYSKAGLEDLVGVNGGEQQTKDASNVAQSTEKLAEAIVTPTDESAVSRGQTRNGSRPSTKKSSRNSEATEDASTGSRPPSRKSTTPHEPRAKTPATKNDDRPTTRRSSVDKLAPKRNDSVPRERRASVSKSDKADKETKPPKPLGPLRSGKHDGEVVMGRPGSPGMEHGPRRKNLNDVNSHLVDPSRLNSSDIRSRAEYLREQRDKLLQLKNEERKKQMNDIQKTTVERPRTARAARGVLEKQEADSIRKEITEKLKAEILTIR